MKVLVTGGAGYIGSHTLVALIESGHNVVVLDNLCNSSAVALERVEEITGQPVNFTQGDVRDRKVLDTLFQKNKIDAVIHFAGLKAVGESVDKPLDYYSNNVEGTIRLCEAMQDASVFNFIFSSSATVYGEGADTPYVETMPRGHASNPYGASKAMIEQILADLTVSESRWSVTLLRYFNPIGAHPSGLIGEDPKGIPNNLLPFVTQVACGKREKLNVFGGDYPTLDGTCIRDYLHVEDLATGHVKALALAGKSGSHVFNLGTGQGYSVLEIIKQFELVTGVKLPYEIVARRAGDLSEVYADVSKAKQELNWTAERSLDDMLRDAWHWQSNNPEGFE